MHPAVSALAVALLLAPAAGSSQTPPSPGCAISSSASAVPLCRSSDNDSTDASAQRRVARSLSEAGRWKDAVRVLRTLTKRYPNDPATHLTLGEVYDRAGKGREALASYEQYSALAPQDARGHLLVGWARLERERPVDALSAFREATKLQPGHPDGHHGAGIALVALTRHEEGLRSFREAVALRPDDAEVWGRMAQAALLLRRPKEAISYWEAALQADPAYFDTRPFERAHWAANVAVTGPQAAARPSRPIASEASRRVSRRSWGASSPITNGSGVVVTAEGHVLTNKHVVRACSRIKLRTETSVLVDARILALDDSDDMAILAADWTPAAVASFRSGPAIRPGDDVVVVGFPLSGLLADQVNVTTGSVSALAGLHNDNHLLQMSAPVQPGSSGGPLFDLSGNVIGIVVTKLNARLVAEETGDFPQNVNFAIKHGVARRFLELKGLDLRTAQSAAARSKADVGELGRAVTVLVECHR